MRQIDEYGSGAYGAPRGTRTHKGIDLSCYPGTIICSGHYGKVTKLGHTYPDDLSFRYVEVTSRFGHSYRFFYVEPHVQIGDSVSPRTVLGHSQDLGKRYPGITNHVHFEVRDENGEVVDTTGYFEEVADA